MKRGPFLACLFFVAWMQLFTGYALLAQTDTRHIYGRVVERNATPIQQATVSLSFLHHFKPIKSVTTDNNGAFSFAGIPAHDSLLLTISCQGHIAYKKEI